MKKIWLLFALAVIIAAQVTFISSFHSNSTRSFVSGTSAVVVSKMKYAFLRTTISISAGTPGSSVEPPVLLVFPNGSQIEITDHFSMDVFLPRSGDFLGNYFTETTLGTSPTSSGDYPVLSLSHNHPIDVDIVPNVNNDYLSSALDPDSRSEEFDKIDVYWFKIQGNAHVTITGYGVAI